MKCVICGRSYRPGSAISFHKLPKNSSWMEQCWMKRGDPTNKNKSRVCSIHFRMDDFSCYFKDGGRRLLKSTAIPSMNLFSKELRDHDYSRDTICTNVENICDNSHNIVASVKTEATEQLEIVEAKSSCSAKTFSDQPHQHLMIDSIVKTEAQSLPDVNTTQRNDADSDEGSTFSLKPEDSVTSDNEVIKVPVPPSSRRRTWRPSRIGDLTIDHFSDPKDRKMNFDMMKLQHKLHMRKYKALREQNRRLETKVKKLKEQIIQMKKNNSSNI